MKRGWIIKSGLLVIACTFALLQFNCEAIEEKVVAETMAASRLHLKLKYLTAQLILIAPMPQLPIS